MVNENGVGVTHEDMVGLLNNDTAFKTLKRKAKAVGIDFAYMYVCDGYPLNDFTVGEDCAISLYIDGQREDGKLKVRAGVRGTAWGKLDLGTFNGHIDKLKKAQKFVKWLVEDFSTAELPKCSKKADINFPLGSFGACFTNAITEKIDSELASYFGINCCRRGVRNADNIIVATADEANHQRKTNAVFCFHVFDLNGNRKSTCYHEFHGWSYSDCFVDDVLFPVENSEYARFTVRKVVDTHTHEYEYETWAFGKNGHVYQV